MYPHHFSPLTLCCERCGVALDSLARAGVALDASDNRCQGTVRRALAMDFGPLGSHIEDIVEVAVEAHFDRVLHVEPSAVPTPYIFRRPVEGYIRLEAL